MDGRMGLQPGTVLEFPGMECRIESFVGRGSNAMVYLGSYPDAQLKGMRHQVLIKELFPYHGKGGIYRDGNQNICHTDEAADVWELHRLSFSRGNEVHLRLQQENPGDIDANLNTFFLHQTYYSVLGFSGGRSLDKELAAQGGGGTGLLAHIRRMLGALDVLEGFHSLGFLHLDISPDNILLIGEGRRERITLIDYNSVHTLEEIRLSRSVYYSAKEGYTAPEIRSGKTGEIGQASDLYAMTAVFYRCLTGKNLTPMQMLRSTPPDISQAPCLTDMPETVRSMVQKILKKGLASLPRRRYQSAEEMRLDLEELQDRVEGKGITHWALWETGRAAVLGAVRTNPALAYIREEEALYPIVGEAADGRRMSLEELLQDMLAPEGASVLLLGGGGAGKTTALLRAAYLQRTEYSGMEPAAVYISLYGCEEEDASYIKDRLLESLRFKPGTDTMETARHELVRLLSSPIHTRFGERPKLLLLLDGLNEASGDTRLLVKEIGELSALPGVRVLLASRREEPALSFSQVQLCPLREDEVQAVLAGSGVLLPENGELRRLIQSPMMLSIYIRTVLDQGRQMAGTSGGDHGRRPDEMSGIHGPVETGNQLLDRYFDSILDKEIRGLPEDSPLRWQIGAALCYVLPETAALAQSRQASLRDEDMLPVADRCWRSLRSRMIFKAFPGWIGHVSDIRGEASDGEAWYGLMVHQILWRRLGMLVRDEFGKYRIVHQLIEEYLAERQGSYGRILRRQRTLRRAAAAACVLGLAGGTAWLGVSVLREISREPVRQPYDEGTAEQAVDAAFRAYISGARQYEAMSGLIDSLQREAAAGPPQEEAAAGSLQEEPVAASLKACREDLTACLSQGPEQAMAYRERLLESGEVMPWSGEPLDGAAYEALAVLPAERAREYLGCIDTLEKAANEPKLWEDFGDAYLEGLDAVLLADAQMLGCYYKEVLEPELEAMADSESEKTREMGSRYRTAVTGYDGQYQISREAEGVPEEYEAAQARARDAFWENTIHGYFRLEEAEEETASQEAVGEAGDAQADAGDAAAHLLTVWSDFLRVVDAAYASELWALDYVDAFLESGDWKDLEKARAACIASARYLTELSMKEEDVSQEEYLALAKAGIDAEYQSTEILSAPELVEEAHRSVRDNRLVKLEQSVFDRTSIRMMKEEGAVRREYISCMTGYYCGMTNYLLLTLGDADAAAVYWHEMEGRYPALTQGRAGWAPDKDAAATAVDAQLDRLEENVNRTVDLLSDSSAQLYGLENSLAEGGVSQLAEAVFPMTNVPEMLPIPEWYNPAEAGYISFIEEESGDILYPESGAPLLDGTYGAYIQVPGVTADAIGDYVDAAAPYAQESWKADDGDVWYLVMSDYHVKLEAGEDGATLLFTGGGAAFAPIWYLSSGSERTERKINF